MDNQQNKVRKSHNGKLIGIILIIFGITYFARHFLPWISFGGAWAIVAIIFGIILLTKK
jgi:uncharacterized membrane protein